MSDWIRDGHRLVAYVELTAPPRRSRRGYSDMRVIIECPGEGKCQAPMASEHGGGCNLVEWMSAEGFPDFIENYLDLPEPAKVKLPFEFEYRWHGGGEDGEPRFRPVT